MRTAIKVLATTLALQIKIFSWSTPVSLSTDVQNGISPQIIIDAADMAVAVWEYYGANTTIQSASLSIGGSWSSSANISDPSFSSIAPRLSIDGAGNVVAIWQQMQSSAI